MSWSPATRPSWSPFEDDRGRCTQTVEQVLTDLKQTEKKYADLERKIAAAAAGDLLEQAQVINGINLLIAEIAAPDAKVLREMTDRLRDELKPALVILAAVAGGKVLPSAMASPEAVAAGAHAGNLVKEAARICGGGGGGRPDMAQAGGKLPEKIKEALAGAAALAADQLNG